jgi:hypothetical protein
MRSASVFYHGMFNFAKFSLPQNVMLKKEIVENTAFHSQLKAFMSSDDLICSEILVNNQVYKNNDIVVLEITDCDNIVVGLIQTVLVKNLKVYFVSKKFEAVRHWLQYFVSKGSKSTCVFTDSDQLADFKPLIKRGTSDKFIFCLHHHISFEYQ